MAIDLGASRPTMYSTWLDVIALLTTQVQTGEADFSNQDLFNRVRQISQIENDPHSHSKVRHSNFQLHMQTDNTDIWHGP